MYAPHDIGSLKRSAIPIRAWLLQGTCDDCLYKTLKEIKPSYPCRYSLAAADSFSAFVHVPDLRHALKIGECIEAHSAVITALERDGNSFLKTFGKHS